MFYLFQMFYVVSWLMVFAHFEILITSSLVTFMTNPFANVLDRGER